MAILFSTSKHWFGSIGDFGFGHLCGNEVGNPYVENRLIEQVKKYLPTIIVVTLNHLFDPSNIIQWVFLLLHKYSWMGKHKALSTFLTVLPYLKK